MFALGKSARGAALICASLTLAACASSGGGGSGSNPSVFNFGAMIPLSGVSSAIGTEARQGIQSAVDQINASGALGQTKLEPIYLDNPGTPETAVTNFKKLDSINHVQFSFTTFSSATTAIAPAATQAKMVLMNPGASTTEFENLSPYLFSDIPLGDAQATAMLDYAYNVLHVRKLAAIYSNDAQGSGFKSVIPDHWKQLGGEYVGDAKVAVTEKNFGGVLNQIRGASPDAVYIGFFGSGQGDLLKQAAQANFKPTWLGSTSVDNQGALKIAGDAVNGVYSTQVQPASSNDASAFTKKYTAQFGSPPSSFAQLSYSGVQVLAQALESLKKQNKNLDGPGIRDEILNLKFSTVNGPMNFQKNGSVAIPITITVRQPNAFKPLAVVDNGKVTKVGP